MPAGKIKPLIEQSEELVGTPLLVGTPFWSSTSKALITTIHAKQSCSSPKTKAIRPATPQTPRTSFHERSTPTSGRYSSPGLGLIMAFNFQNSGGSSFGLNSTPTNNGNNSQAQAQNGADLEDIQTEALGFHAIAGDAKVQLLSTPWPSDNLPPTTSSLLSIASRRGLLAAAGPDRVVVASTENVRKAFEAPGGAGNKKPFEPQLQLPMPFRISQLTFSTDEEYLIITAETGGGLAVYEVQSLLKGNTESAFQIATNNEAIRALVPNPAAEKGELIAVVTAQGKLMVANLKQKDFISGANGPVLKENVSCVSWSKLGKQLVAGLSNGTAYQMTPEGVGKADIPSPPNLSGDFHVSQILWLETSVFLTVHTPTSFDNNQAPSSEFHIVTKQAAASQNSQPAFGQAPQQSQAPTYIFQKLSEPAGPYGLNRSPPHHSILRLSTFPPNLQDVLIVASSASSDIGLLTRSGAPLESTKRITNVFTCTEPADDSRRAALPISADGFADTSPIGMALDLSAKDGIYRPIPLDDEIDRSDGPLPGVMVLNNEGVLASWWVVYSDSIRQKTTYPGLVASQQATQQPPAQQQPPFGSNTNQSPFGAPSKLGAPSAFGVGSGLGQKSSPWGTAASSSNTAATPAAPTFGSSTFGTPSALPSALAAPAKPFQSTTGLSATPSFGQPASFGTAAVPNQKASPWGTPSTTTSSTAPASGGFASFATKGGFAAAATSSGGNALPSQPSGDFSGFSGGSSAFGQPDKKPTSLFGQPEEKPASSLFGQPEEKPASSLFGQPEEKPTSIFGGPPATTSDSSSSPDKPMFASNSLFGSNDKPKDAANSFGKPEQNGNNPFGQNKLGGLFGTGPVSSMGNTADKPNPFAQGSSGSTFGSTTFKLGTTFKPDGSAKDDLPKPTGGSLFGPNFGDALNSVQTPTSKDESMGGSNETSTTPSATPITSNFGIGDAAVKTGSSGDGGNDAIQPPTTTTSIFGGSPTSGSLFGGPKKDTPAASTGSVFGGPKPAESSKNASIFGDSKPQEAPKNNGSLFGNFGTPAKSKSPEPITTTPADNTRKDTTKEGTVPEPEAPLPPDFSSVTKSAATDAPLPPDFSALPKDAAADAPLPPDFFPTATTKDDKKDEPPPLAEDSDISNVHETGDETYSLQTDDDGDDEGGFSEEGSGEDVTKDLSPVSDSNNTPSHTPQSSFGDRAVNKGASSLFSSINKPTQSSSSRPPLFGEIHFPPPAAPGSPRSPSPVRSAVPNRVRPDTLRSVSTPPVAFGRPGSSSRPNSSGGKSAYSRLAPQATFSMVDQKIAEDAKRAKAKAEKEAKEAEEAQAMIDHEDNLAQKQLSEEIVPTTVLDEFIAHQDYIGSADRTGIPAQVETVYRDINSMVDTLGMNARALKAFIIGHTKDQQAAGRTKEDLGGDEDDWVLVEIENLTEIIERDLARELEENRIKDVSDKMKECSDLKNETMMLKQKHQEVRKIFGDKADPELRESVLSAPLTGESARQQAELRAQFTAFLEKLIEAEKQLAVLKAKLVASGKAGANAGGGPTIEAVMRTISKMTAMAEKKSGDVDVLESELSKLNLGASRGPGSREGSPFAASILSSPLGQSTLRSSTAMRTPLRSSMRNSYGMGRSSGIYQTPDSGRSTQTPNGGFGMSTSMFSRSRGSLSSSLRSSMIGSPAKLTPDNVPDELLQRMSKKMARKKAVAEELRTAMSRVGPRVLGLDYDYD